MTDATKVILQQWGAFGAVLIILGLVIWKLWTDSNKIMNNTITTLTADNKDLTAQLAESNRLRIAEHITMTATLVEMTKDNANGSANSTNAIEAVSAGLSEVKTAIRDTNEELRRRRGG